MKPLPLLLSAVAAQANPQASANYSIAPDTTGYGGGSSQSALYSNTGSVADITGISSVSAPAESARHGYIGQLYELDSFQITAAPPTVNEGAPRQLAATAILDDLTTIPYDPAQVTWSIVSGPVVSISTGGLATAGDVYQNTPATVQGTAGSASGTLVLTVLDILPDNFQLYAGDGLPDHWQVQYFGVNNPLAAPLLDPDSDGFDNLFEYHACLLPNSPFSAFHLRLAEVPGQPSQRRIFFSPATAECTYQLQSGSSLLAPDWTSVPGAILTTGGGEWSLTDPAATPDRRFYRIVVQRQ